MSNLHLGREHKQCLSPKSRERCKFRGQGNEFSFRYAEFEVPQDSTQHSPVWDVHSFPVHLNQLHARYRVLQDTARSTLSNPPVSFQPSLPLAHLFLATAGLTVPRKCQARHSPASLTLLCSLPGTLYPDLQMASCLSSHRLPPHGDASCQSKQSSEQPSMTRYDFRLLMIFAYLLSAYPTYAVSATKLGPSSLSFTSTPSGLRTESGPCSYFNKFNEWIGERMNKAIRMGFALLLLITLK